MESIAVERAQALLLSFSKRARAEAWKTEVEAYLQERVKLRRMSENCATSRRAVLLSFAERMSVTDPLQVTTKLVQRWYDENVADFRSKSAGANDYLRYLRSFFKHLMEHEKLRLNPASEVKTIVARKRARKRFCMPAEVRALIDAIPEVLSAPEADEMRFVLYAGFHCGLRRDEISEARWEWFDLQTKAVHVCRSDTWEPKDGDDRTIPMTEEFATFLQRWRPTSAPCDAFVLRPTKSKGKWRYRFDFRAPFEKYMQARSMAWVTPHTMRRTFASLLVSAGVSIYKVATWLGDGVEVVQRHYGFLVPSDKDIERGLSQLTPTSTRNS